jgi:DnaJ-class molecular chaperone
MEITLMLGRVVCRECGGSGEIDEPTYPYPETCWLCTGTGWEPEAPEEEAE